MNALIVFDSLYGNTEKIAEAIGRNLDGEVSVVRVSEMKHDQLKGADLLILGSPTHGGRPTPALQSFLSGLPGLNGMKAAAFDTRISAEKSGFMLKLIIKTFGYAADKIIQTLTVKGGRVIAEPKGFIVIGKEGPLADGEFDKAKQWAVYINAQSGSQ